VIPSYEMYFEEEDRLTAAEKSGDPEAIERAQTRARVSGVNAAISMSHVPDYIATERLGRAAKGHEVEEVRDVAIAACKWIGAVGDVADADKHSMLRNPGRYVLSATGTVVSGVGYGQLGYGEGKYGGGMQVVVVPHNSTQAHALSFILLKSREHWDRQFASAEVIKP